MTRWPIRQRVAGLRLRRRPHLDFLVLCAAHAGSAQLTELLDSHPDVRCIPDPFRPELGDADDPGSPVALAHLARELPRIRHGVIGSELRYPTVYAFPHLLDLLHDPDLRVIRPRRENHLVAHVLAHLEMARASAEEPATSFGRVHLDPEACVRAMHDWDVMDRLLDFLSRHNATLAVEHDVLDTTAAHAELCRFLGVPPRPLDARRRDDVAEPLSETIENWDEIVAALRPTPWSRFVSSVGARG